MWGISAEFEVGIREGAPVAIRVEVVTPAGALVDGLDLEVLGGSVSVDANAVIQRSATVELLDRTGTLTPLNFSDPFHPASGHQLRIFRGLELSAGVELVPVFFGPIYDVEIVDRADGLLINATCYDRMRLISDADWENPYVIPPGLRDIASYFEDIADNRLPGTDVVFGLTGSQNLLSPIAFGVSEGDPAQDMAELARNIGGRSRFGVDGLVHLEPVPVLGEAPETFTYSEGDGEALLSVTRKLSKETIYNGVIVRLSGSGITTPTQVTVWDVDPASPTYYLGPFGKKPKKVSTSIAPNAGWGAVLGIAELNKRLGAVEAVTVETMVNPAQEAFDAIRIEREESHLASAFIVDTLSIPLTAEERMVIGCRARQGLAEAV